MRITFVSRRGRMVSAAALTLAAGILLAGCSSPSASDNSDASGTTAVSYQLGWLPTVEWGGNWIADDKGYYKNDGVDFTWLTGGPNVTSDTVVASGKALVGSSNADTIAKAISEGADLKIFGATFQKNPFCILSKADNPINSPQDMIGKKIGVAAGNQTAFELMLAINGIDVSQIQIVPVQYDPAPVANGEVDGQVVFSINEPTQLERQGIDTHVMLFADYGYDIFADVFFATNETIKNDPEALAAFLKATRKGYQDLIDDPAEAATLAVNTYGKDQGLNLEQQTLQAKAMKSLMITDEVTEPIALPQDLIDANIKTISKLGIDISADDLFTNEILDRIDG